METFYTPHQAGELPPASRLLVLAPHPDDEIFGCAGSLARYRAQGADIVVHVLTDGAGYAPESERQEIAACRRAETNAALEVLGVPVAAFGPFRDRELVRDAGLADYLLGLLEQHRPELVMAPSLWEIHPDHLATGRALLLAIEYLRRRAGPIPGLMFYEIGAPLRADLLVDITTTWEAKQQSMRCFPSQLAQQDYARHISSLNAYRTYTLPSTVSYAEAFAYIPPTEVEKSGDWTEQRVLGRWAELALATADAQAEILQAALAAREGDLQTALVALEKNRQELEQVCAENHLILNSSSWRLTAPLRWLRRQFSSVKDK